MQVGRRCLSHVLVWAIFTGNGELFAVLIHPTYDTWSTAIYIRCWCHTYDAHEVSDLPLWLHPEGWHAIRQQPQVGGKGGCRPPVALAGQCYRQGYPPKLSLLPADVLQNMMHGLRQGPKHLQDIAPSPMQKPLS